MNIIPRADWGARHPDGFRPAPLPAREVWLHHSAGSYPTTVAAEHAEMRDLEDIGQDRFGGGISYTFVVMPSGRVFAGHSVHRQGAHTGGRNDIARAICLPGNYDQRQPTDAQLDAVAALLRHGAAQGWWTDPRLTGGHRDLKATACPGRHAYARIDDINRLAASGGGAAAPGGDDDMPSKEEVAEAVWTYPIGNRRFGRTEYAETLLGSNEERLLRILEHRDAKRHAEVRGQVAGLTEALQQLAGRDGLDLEAVERAAEAGTRRALDEGTVDVDVTVAGGGSDE